MNRIHPVFRIALSVLVTTIAGHTAEHQLTLKTRDRISTVNSDGKPEIEVRHQTVQWEPRETAVIVCDMWDAHHCLNAVRRVKQMAPRMNDLLKNARQRGALIIHAPSSCMKFYEKHPARQRARQAPTAANLPKDIGNWQHWLDAGEEQKGYPIDHSDGGEDDDPAEHKKWHEELRQMGRNPGSPWIRQTALLEIDELRDVISDSGVEIWNLLEQHSIRNILLVGVHTNMCVLGRPFGLRKMVKNGKNVLLMRDLTDAMYNPARAPFVDHFRGTELVIEHIERMVCPTTTSDQLLGSKPFRFKGDTKPRLVFMIGEDEYDTSRTLPTFARRFLEFRDIESQFVHVSENDPNNFPKLEALKNADLLFISVRRRTPPKEQMDLIRAHIAKGKPLVGIRTTSHAFDRDPPPPGHVRWEAFDREVLGAHYQGHYGNKPPRDPATLVKASQPASEHPVLAGVPIEELQVTSHLYRNRDLAPDVTVLMHGRVEGRRDTTEPVAWTRTVNGSRVFYTSLGNPADFELPAFQRLLLNGVLWAMNEYIPPPDASIDSLDTASKNGL